MHIWDDKQSSVMLHDKVSAKKMDYSHCPLKKRPVKFVKYIKEEMEFDGTEDYAEPENLSTKPQDLSVKCKTAVEVTATALDVKKEPQSPYQHQHQHQYRHVPASVPLHQNVPAPASPVSSPYHQQQHQLQYPYQPMAVKPGPLEPLCLNIAGGDHMQTVQHSLAAVQPYHHHHLHHNRLHYAPAAPRPVPAQYPGTGYLAGYVYHHGGLQAAERAYPPVTAGAYPPTVMLASAVRDPSLSPPGSNGSGSAFKPLLQHASPPSATVTSRSPPAPMTWYNRGGGWSPSATDVDVSPPLPSSSSSMSAMSAMSAVSPPYGLPPPPAAVQLYQHCSGESDASSSTVITSCGVVAKPNANVSAVLPSATADRYKCNSCAKSYLTVAGLAKHHQNHCSDDDCSGPGTAASAAAGTAASAAAGTAAAAKTFCCKYCDKAYNTLGALKMHIRTHTLPCICNLCGKAFSRPWLLQGHIRTHTGEKPFSCPHCNRAFADRSNLRAHLQTHSDVKKYSCATCSKTFSRMSLLTKHCDTGCPRLQPPQQQQQPL